MKNITKLIGAAALLAVVALALTGCGKKEDADSAAWNAVDTVAKLKSPQLDSKVAKDETEVKIETTQGDITLKLFPKITPKAVENFVEHAKKGYYNGTTFHRVIKEFMIQGGDPEGTGMGGESIWGKGFGVEFSNQLYHIRGALAMAKSSAPNSQGSQFYIVQNDENVQSQVAKGLVPDGIYAAYAHGGAPSLDGHYTVFGQVIKGMDVVDKIADVEVDSSDKPVETQTIKKITVIKEAK
ncbi:MAG: peptidylprolyl isomerase [Lactobacillales bacterium]|jgi:peptidyl-prolyl cis-trans isomerase A (cyclophilin A)|nr:peptidylprolyl isomerase [Lactobacillales bacterium]